MSFFNAFLFSKRSSQTCAFKAKEITFRYIVFLTFERQMMVYYCLYLKTTGQRLNLIS